MRKGSVSKLEKKAIKNRHADFKCARGLQESALWSSLQARSTSPLVFLYTQTVYEHSLGLLFLEDQIPNQEEETYPGVIRSPTLTPLL